jgi:predicted nucleic acid-binding protein
VNDPLGQKLPGAQEEASSQQEIQILVPDASVGVKWYIPEPDSREALNILDPRFELHVPSYFFTEAANVLQRKVAVERSLSEAEGLEIFHLLHTLPMNVRAADELLEDALRHGIRYRRPVYNCLYLVLAESLDGKVVTGDRRLYNGVRGGPLGHLVWWVGDPL